LPYNG